MKTQFDNEAATKTHSNIFSFDSEKGDDEIRKAEEENDRTIIPKTKHNQEIRTGNDRK